MTTEYVVAWGRVLAALRASDAYVPLLKTEDVLSKFDQTLKSLNCVAATLSRLQSEGCVKNFTGGFSVGGEGYQGFWEASLPFIYALERIHNFITNMATHMAGHGASGLAQQLQQVKLMDGSTLPPLATTSHRNQTDLRAWRTRLSQEREMLSVRIEAIAGQSQVSVASVASTAKPAEKGLSFAKPPEKAMLTGKVEVQQEPIAPAMPMLKKAAAPKAPPPAEHFALSSASCAQLLHIAVANADVDVHGLADSVLSCRRAAAGLDAATTQQLKDAEERLKQLLDVRLEDAVNGLDPKNLWVTFTRMYRLANQCRTLGFDAGSVPAQSKARQKMQELKLSDDAVLNVFKLPRVDSSASQFFQNLLDVCRCPSFGPMGFPLPRLLVERVIEVHHECTRAEYLLRRSQLVPDCDNGVGIQEVHVKSQDVNWQQFLGNSHMPLEAKYNEFYCFHGTSPAIAEVITDTDFKIKRTADHGYTFGRGVYLSEYATHAQFFAQDVCGGFDDNRCAILVCRAFCGRIQQAGQWPKTAQPHDRKAEFEARLSDGSFHSTLGAEWPSNYELREFIVADDDQVLPEFIVICRNA